MTALNPRDLHAQLTELSRSRRPDDLRPVAIFGTCAPATLEVEGVPWDVVPVRGELDLRRHLARRDVDTLTAFVVVDDTLPLDLACRLRGARVHRLGVAWRLVNQFGARSVAPGLSQTALAARALDLPSGSFIPVDHPVLSTDDLWSAVLAHVLAAAPPVDVRGWLLRAARADGPAHVGSIGATEGLLDELDLWLREPERLGPAAAAVRGAWQAGSGAELLGWATLLAAAAALDDPQVHAALKLALRFTAHAALAEPAVATPLRDALDDVLTAADEHTRGRVLAAAEAALARLGEGTAELAARSRWLPTGRRALQAKLGAALAASLQDNTALTEAWSLVERLRAHRDTDDDAHERDLHATRLAAWCAWRGSRGTPEPTATWVDVVPLAREYHREGGWVDRCRERLRAHPDTGTALDHGVRAVLDHADALRRDLDHRFAEALVAWHEAGCPRKDLLPLHRATADICAPFLAGDPNRRLLVVLMDGLTRAGLVSLLLAESAWRPLRVHNDRPVLAELPTVTHVSRAAFFHGKHDVKTHGPSGESNDSRRWASNAAMSPYFVGPGRVFEKRDLKGALHADLQAALRDKDQRVVAVIVNAVDEDLGGSSQVHPDLAKGAVPALRQLLDLAGAHGWAALLVADHGHVHGDHLRGRAAPSHLGAGDRWRSLPDGAALHPDEVALPASAWRPPGASRSAAFWDERQVWGGHKKGAHGGVTLAEVVVPCELIAPEHLYYYREGRDEGLRAAPLEPPPWWTGTAPPPHRAAAPPPPSDPQPDLFAAPPPPPPPVDRPDDRTHHPLVAALRESKLFRASFVDHPEVPELLRTLDVMVRASHGGAERSLPGARLAEALGWPARRVPGRIAALQFFQIDGQTLLEADWRTGLVTLHLERMKAQYGIA